MDFRPTPEQEMIFEAARESNLSLMINAYAGTGKTTTLVEMAKVLTSVPTLALAFNVDIKKELERRLPPFFTVLTMNGLGHRAWGQFIGKRPIVEPKKLGKLVTEFMRKGSCPKEWWEPLRALVSQAMSVGIVPQECGYSKPLVEDSPVNWQNLIDYNFLDLPKEAIEVARLILIENINLGRQGTISYDDQVYLPIVFGAAFPRFPRVLVDESQDLNPLNHQQVRRSCSDRLIVCGDRKQAIYAFRGASVDSMDRLRELRPEWLDLPLTMTFRCPRAVVDRQQGHAPGFQALPQAPEGSVHQWASVYEDENREWDWSRVQSVAHPKGTTAILCRNNAPLIKMAFTLIRNGVAPIMLKGDIGKSLIKLAKKIMPLDGLDAPTCRMLIKGWQESEENSAREKDQEERISAIRDRAHCLLAVLDFANAKTAKELCDALETLFSAEYGAVTLGTIHGAKGLEWDTVLHLDPWRIPSKYAKAAAARGDRKQIQQEFNLRYVGETRTKRVLILASFQDFTGVKDPEEELEVETSIPNGQDDGFGGS